MSALVVTHTAAQLRVVCAYHRRGKEEMKFNLMENFILMVSNYVMVKNQTLHKCDYATSKIQFLESPSYKNMIFSHI